MLEAGVDGFHDLANPGQPAPPRPRPRGATVALGRAEDHRAVGILPMLMACWALKALISYIDALSWGADAHQPRVPDVAYGKEGVSQGLIRGATGTKAKAGDHAH